jgi:hypothetical protein
MARMPSRPTGDDGQPIVPSATAGDDDVQGHIAFTVPADEDDVEEGPEPA